LNYIFLFLCQFFLFKFLYPFPSFFSDSNSYISAAASHLGANIWPVGYSKFLLLFHNITHSSTALTLFQYILFELIALYFYRTILFFFSPTRLSAVVLQIFLFFNPLNLFLANLISSDGPFAALSLLWLTTLIWLIYKPSFAHLIILTAVCFIAFTFRYNAMYYPIISAPIFIFSNKSLWFKLIGVLSPPLLILPFILYTSNAAKEMSGTSQFPPILGGWQWANNALYIREYINEDSTHFPSAEISELDQLARDFYRRVPQANRELRSYVGNYFIREPRSPLKLYMAMHYGDDTSNYGVTAWAKSAPLFKDYGLYLIKKHPIPFATYFMIPNSKNYLIPPLEKLKVFNIGSRHISKNAAIWFDYPSQNVSAASITLQGYLLAFYPYLFFLLNVWFVFNLIVLLKNIRGLRPNLRRHQTMLLLIVLVVLNAAFSIFANIVVFRYQIFPLYTLLLINLLAAEFIQQNNKKLTTP